MPVIDERVWGRVRTGCRVGVRCLGGFALVLTLTAATCTSGMGVDFKATPASLAEAATRTASEAYRTETQLSFGDTVKERFARGAVDADKFEATVDVEPVLRALRDELPDVLRGTALDTDSTSAAVNGWTVDWVGNCSALYLRSTVYEDLHALKPRRDPDLMAELGRLENEWGHIDLAATDERRPLHVSSHLAPFENPDPRDLLDRLTDVTSVEDLGDKTIRGQDLAGVVAQVHIADLIEVLGNRPDEMAEHAGNAYQRELVHRTLQLTIPIEVWINEDGLVHQIHFELTLDHIIDQTGEDRSLVATGLQHVGFYIDRAYTVDYFDHAEPVNIDVPGPHTSFDLSKLAVSELS